MRHALTPDVELVLPLPAAAQEARVRPLDMSAVPGAELVVQRAWTIGSGRLELACARADGGLWVEGLEQAALSGASAITRKHLGLPSLTAGPVQARGAGYGQAFESQTAAGQARGLHLLGFVGEQPVVVLCTSVCIDQRQPSACAASVEQMSFDGKLGAPPEPGALAQALSLAVGHPQISLAGAGVLLVAVVALILGLRPRPRR